MKVKSIFVAFVTVISIFQIKAQWFDKSFTFETNLREYRIYVPPIYNPTNPVSLVITLHGLGDNMTNFSSIGMNLIADTANFLVLIPQALSDPKDGNCWNSGVLWNGHYPNDNINDVGFLNALIDTVLANYSVNASRVYMCGFSMGGLMTQRMACESNKKIAAFASAGGTIGQGITRCNPERPIPIAHFMGTNDPSYYTNVFGINTDSLIHFWVDNNYCDTTAIHSDLPDLANDGYTVEHFVYPNGQQNTEVELFKINDAGHVWLLKPKNDISYSEEIWKFFNKCQLYTSIGYQKAGAKNIIRVYPNPFNDYIYIEFLNYKNVQVELLNSRGYLLQSFILKTSITQLNLNNLSCGLYITKIKCSDGIEIRKIIKF